MSEFQWAKTAEKQGQCSPYDIGGPRQVLTVALNIAVSVPLDWNRTHLAECLVCFLSGLSGVREIESPDLNLFPSPAANEEGYERLRVCLKSCDLVEADRAFARFATWEDTRYPGQTREEAVYFLHRASFQSVESWCRAAMELHTIFDYSIQKWEADGSAGV